MDRRQAISVQIGGADVVVCCPGCRAAAQLIAAMGLVDFYRLRTAPSIRPDAQPAPWEIYDQPALLEALTRRESNGRSVVLLINGLTCAACSWLITSALSKTPGVLRSDVNMATARAHVVWDDTRLPFSQLLARIAALGYRPQPVTVEAAAARLQEERHAILKRLAVAGLGMMQVMMFAVAIYAGDWYGGMDVAVLAYLRLISLLVATPVMFYGGWPFFAGAARALASRKVTMDVPVALSLLLAYGASVYNVWRHAGHVYLDSITMFIFFLTVARYVEMIARHQCTGVSDALSGLLPPHAHRLQRDLDGESVSDVAITQLAAGDRLLVRAGEVIPADGVITAGDTRVDESMLSGEALGLARRPGEVLAAGSVNLDAPVQMRVNAVGAATVLSSIVALLDRALAERPRITQAADRLSSRFLTAVLIGAAAVYWIWSSLDPTRAFSATLAVLVVACPCALSLATSVAVASANAALARRGVLVTRADAVESLAKATRVVFDKTGTLTSGAITVARCRPVAGRAASECLALAGALEACSEHPIARAFAGAGAQPSLATEIRIVAGSGIEGVVGGERYRIGTHAFVSGPAAAAGAPQAGLRNDEGIWLGSGGQMLAAFTLGDRARPESAAAAAALRALGLELEILSGDSLDAVVRVAAHCGIAEYRGRQSPLEKLRHIRALAGRGEFVAMVGDGINDAPVLGGAGVSIAMGRGSALAHASADLILVGDSLQALPQAFVLARRARRIIKQNLLWAAGYNLTAMPIAAMGWVPPWLAAIGMSASSIFVVLNSLRLLREPRARGPDSNGASDATAFAIPAPSVASPIMRSN
jgi:Cu2+-exporting ATPase